MLSTQDGDLLLGMPWIYKICSLVDNYSKKTTIVHQRQTHVLDVNFRGEFVPVIADSAIPNIIKTYVPAYLIVAKGCSCI